MCASWSSWKLSWVKRQQRTEQSLTSRREREEKKRKITVKSREIEVKILVCILF